MIYNETFVCTLGIYCGKGVPVIFSTSCAPFTLYIKGATYVILADCSLNYVA